MLTPIMAWAGEDQVVEDSMVAVVEEDQAEAEAEDTDEEDRISSFYFFERDRCPTPRCRTPVQYQISFLLFFN